MCGESRVLCAVCMRASSNASQLLARLSELRLESRCDSTLSLPCTQTHTADSRRNASNSMVCAWWWAILWRLPAPRAPRPPSPQRARRRASAKSQTTRVRHSHILHISGRFALKRNPRRSTYVLSVAWTSENRQIEEMLSNTHMCLHSRGVGGGGGGG